MLLLHSWPTLFYWPWQALKNPGNGSPGEGTESFSSEKPNTLSTSQNYKESKWVSNKVKICITVTSAWQSTCSGKPQTCSGVIKSVGGGKK